MIGCSHRFEGKRFFVPSPTKKGLNGSVPIPLWLECNIISSKDMKELLLLTYFMTISTFHYSWYIVSRNGTYVEVLLVGTEGVLPFPRRTLKIHEKPNLHAKNFLAGMARPHIPHKTLPLFLSLSVSLLPA